MRAIGGWESYCDSSGKLELTLHQTKKISLDISEAGPGSLTAEFRGPNEESVPAAIETISPSKVRVLLTPRDAGEHTLHLNFGSIPLPGTPLQGTLYMLRIS